MNRARIIFLIFLFVGLARGQAPALNIYGYFDIESEISDRDSQGKIWSFDQHHLNLISVYSIDHEFTLFTEMEWEHGPIHTEQKNVGKIYLTRAWLEYKYSDAIKIQAGKFLLPFGIFGVKYDATPTYLTVSLSPAIYGKYINSAGVEDRLFAKYPTGVQFTGVSIINNWSFEYFLNLSNGRGPTAAEEDTNVDKALGARILTQSPEDVIQFGVSYYSDRDGNSNNIRQNAFGMDIQLMLGESSLISEVIVVTDELLDQDLSLTGKFRKREGAYIQYSYMLANNLAPYISAGSFTSDASHKFGDDNYILIGLNYSITPRIYLKGDLRQFSHKANALQDYKQIELALTVAF